MTDYDSVDFFADASLLEDPYPYFEHLRSQVSRPADGTRTAWWRCRGTRRPRRSTSTPRPSPRATRWSGPSPPSRCPSRATTSARPSTPTATSCPCSSTWSPWTLRCTPRSGRSSCGCSRRSGSRRTRPSCGAWPIGRSTSSSPTATASSSRPTRSPLPCWPWPTCSAFPKRTTSGSARGSDSAPARESWAAGARACPATR